MSRISDLGDHLNTLTSQMVKLTESARKEYDIDTDIHVKEMNAFLKSCNKDLSSLLKKFEKAKPEDHVKYANQVLGITSEYAQNMVKYLTGNALIAANSSLHPILEKMQVESKKIVSAKHASPESIKILLEAQKKWSATKDTIVSPLQKLANQIKGNQKDALKELNELAKGLAKVKESPIIKLLTGFDRLEGEKQKLAAPKLIESVEKLSNDLNLLAVSPMGSGTIRDQGEEFYEKVEDIKKLLKKV